MEISDGRNGSTRYPFIWVLPAFLLGVDREYVNHEDYV
jgi:hypothetical protein